MDLGEIFSDSLVYPLQNIKALVIFVILGIIFGIAVIGTFVAIVAGAATNNVLAIIGSGFIGIVIALILAFAIMGYELDIIKLGIQRDPSAPGIDFVRQFVNGVKYFIVTFVYMIIPAIVSAILALIFQNWISTVFAIILGVIFSLALFMAQCRLAKTGDLGYALAIGEAIGDISRVGFLRLVVFIIITTIFEVILVLIVRAIANWNATVGGILLGILLVYLTFFISRATGLLYSDV